MARQLPTKYRDLTPERRSLVNLACSHWGLDVWEFYVGASHSAVAARRGVFWTARNVMEMSCREAALLVDRDHSGLVRQTLNWTPSPREEEYQRLVELDGGDPLMGEIDE